MGKVQSGAHSRFYIRYHFVWIVKYRKDLLFDSALKETVKKVLLEIGDRHGFELESIGTDGNHVHLFLGASSRYSPARIVEILKSLSAREVFRLHPEVKKELWGGQFWGEGYYVGTVGREVTESIVKRYIQEQGQESKHKSLSCVQLSLF